MRFDRGAASDRGGATGRRFYATTRSVSASVAGAATELRRPAWLVSVGSVNHGVVHRRVWAEPSEALTLGSLEPEVPAGQ